MWLAFLRQLFEGGHYAADPGVRADDLEGDAGAALLQADGADSRLCCLNSM